ncbi:MAG TPA: LacI family DNA-binding transcriptional regulator [Thermotogota bacterium]|nr:LacI family DNA-binding transcriptional regulator [Thermotogota bacterium]HPJ87549.1 LacI family DNA-binding transcriptional regulator [Thermotogota bacterium]HPR94754.1 LacI family DNA-binding transcriptional regulator [Thermotogota bacterium]
MRSKNITIRDVAREAGVGVGTVSRVLNSGSVKEDTRKKVLETIEKLGYKPNFFARTLAGGKSDRILTIMPEVKSEFHWRILESFDHEIDKENFQSIIYPLISKKRYEALISNPSFIEEVEGVVIMTITPDIINGKLEINAPVVLIEEKSDKCSCVYLNNRKGGRIAANHLLERNVSKYYAIYSSAANPYIKNEHMKERIIGYMETLKDAGKKFEDDQVIYADYSLGPSIDQIKKMLTETKRPGIFAMTDNFALSVLQVASTIGLHPGKDFFIVGYDNQSWTEKAGLTTVEQPIEEFGKTGAKLLMERIKNPDAPIRQIEFPPLLIKRNTT